MNQILVTGAHGFLGSYVIRQLSQMGLHVLAVDKVIKNLSLPGIQEFTLNLFNQEQMRLFFEKYKPTEMLHLAWYTEHGKFWTSEENLKWVNVSLDLIKLFKNNGGKRFVGAGTCAEYEWGKEMYFQEEISPLKPKTLYGICKKSVFEILSSYASQNQMEMAWGRVFFLYGPGEGEKRVVPYVINQLLKKEVAQCSSGNFYRDFLHVEDVARSFVSILLTQEQGAFNIGSGEAQTLKSILIEIGRLLDREKLIQFGNDNPNESQSILANVEKIKKIGFKPQISLMDGLKESIEFWKRKQRLP